MGSRTNSSIPVTFFPSCSRCQPRSTANSGWPLQKRLSASHYQSAYEYYLVLVGMSCPHWFILACAFELSLSAEFRGLMKFRETSN
jgi:hypothetical protein